MISPVKLWRRQNDVRKLLGKEGKVLTWTIISVPSVDFKKQAPYAVVLVAFESGEKAVGQLVEYKEEQLKIGLRVRAILRKTRSVSQEDIIPYGLKFQVTV